MVRIMLVAAGMLATVGPAFAALHMSDEVPSNGSARADNVRVQYVDKDKWDKDRWKEKYKWKDAEKYEWKGGGCKYEYKADRKGVKEKYKCK